MKKSFVLYSDLIHTTNKLSNEQAGELFKLILSYANDDPIQVDSLLLEIAFEPIKQQMERDKIKWADTLQKRKEAGSLGGQAKAANLASASDAKQKVAKGSKAKQDLANLAVNVNVTDNVSVTDTVTETVKEKINKKNTARGTRLQKDWIPENEDCAFLFDNRQDLDLNDTVASFIDYWTSATGAKANKLDWSATWRNWVRNSRKDYNAKKAQTKAEKQLEHDKFMEGFE